MDKRTLRTNRTAACSYIKGKMDTHEFMEIIKHLVQEKKDLKKRLDVMEEILHSYIPEIKKERE